MTAKQCFYASPLPQRSETQRELIEDSTSCGKAEHQAEILLIPALVIALPVSAMLFAFVFLPIIFWNGL